MALPDSLYPSASEVKGWAVVKLAAATKTNDGKIFKKTIMLKVMCCAQNWNEAAEWSNILSDDCKL